VNLKKIETILVSILPVKKMENYLMRVYCSGKKVVGHVLMFLIVTK